MKRQKRNSFFWPIFGILLFQSPLFAADKRLYQTNATAIVNMSEVILKRDKIKQPLTPEQKLQQIKDTIFQLNSDAYYFDNSKAIDLFLSDLKKQKLDKSLMQLIKNLERARDHARYEVTWSFLKTFTKSNAIALLDEKEYQELMEQFISLQKLRAKRSQKEEWAKTDLKEIQEFEIRYKNLRPGQVEKNRLMCQSEIDWSALFAPRKGQTSTGWCYAYAYADYLEATHRQNISSADLVLKYKKIAQKDDFDRYNRQLKLAGKPPLTDINKIVVDYIYKGGEFEKIFRKQETISVCAENDLRSEAKDKMGQPVDMGYVIEWINEIGNDFKKNILTQDEIKTKLQNFAYNEIFPNVNIDETLSLFKEASEYDLYVYLAERTCQNKRITLENKTSTWVIQGYSAKYSLMNSFEKLIEKIENEPVIVSVNDNFLYKENIWGKDQASNHVITITGKRWNEQSGHCEFKIRNSQTVPLNTTERAWYSDTELLRNVRELYIEPLKPIK